jgi:phospholipid-binding lipoprotein MlaA
MRIIEVTHRNVQAAGRPVCFLYLIVTSLLIFSSPTKGLCDTNAIIAEAGSEIQSDQAGEEDDFADFEDEIAGEAVSLRDPLEGLNRAIFTFNDRAYYWVIKPTAQGYNRIAPTLVRKGVRNFFNNLEFPLRFVNCLLQGKGRGAIVEISRFMMNSTFGIIGIWDPARQFFHLEPVQENFGQTLGRHGVGNGFYIVLPFLGPSTLRDSIGLVGDGFLKPVSYVDPYLLSLSISTYKNFNAISLRIGDYETLNEAAIDPYSAFKDAYLKYMKHQVAE